MGKTSIIDTSAADHMIGTSVFGQSLSGGTITGSQNAAMQSAAYNNMIQNAQIAKTTAWGNQESTRTTIGMQIERASNGYIIRSEGTSVIATTLEALQQHVTAIVVSNLVLDVGK